MTTWPAGTPAVYAECPPLIHALTKLAGCHHAYTEHPVMFDIHKLELYCRQCRDYIYVQQFDEALAVSLLYEPASNPSHPAGCIYHIQRCILFVIPSTVARVQCQSVLISSMRAAMMSEGTHSMQACIVTPQIKITCAITGYILLTRPGVSLLCAAECSSSATC